MRYSTIKDVVAVVVVVVVIVVVVVVFMWYDFRPFIAVETTYHSVVH